MTWPRATGPRSVHQTARRRHFSHRPHPFATAGTFCPRGRRSRDHTVLERGHRRGDSRSGTGPLGAICSSPQHLIRRSTPSITRTPTPPPSVPHDEMARPLRQVVSWVAAPPACSGEAPTRSLSEAPRRYAVASDRRARPRWRPATGGRPRPRRLPARSLARRAPASPERRPPSLPCTARTISSRSLYASSCFLQQPVFP